MSTDLESVPLEELIAKARRNALEKMLVPMGCWLSFCLAIGIAIFVFPTLNAEWDTKILMFLLLSLPVAIALVSAASYLSRVRNRKFIDKLERISGDWSLARYIRYYSRRAARDEIWCICRMWMPPCTAIVFGTIRVSDTESNESWMLMMPWRGFRNERLDSTYNSRVRELTVDESQQIEEIIRANKGGRSRKFLSTIIDGGPAELAIVFGDGTRPITIRANLAGIPAKHRGDKRIHLIQCVSRLLHQ